MCLPDYVLKGDGSRKTFTDTIIAEKEGLKGEVAGVNPTADWYRQEPAKGIRELVVSLGQDNVYSSNDKEPPDRGPRVKGTGLEIREPSYGGTNLLTDATRLHPKISRWSGDWAVKGNALVVKNGSLELVAYSGSDFCFEMDVKYDDWMKLGVVFRSSDGSEYVFSFPVDYAPQRQAALKEVRKGTVTRKSMWMFVVPPPDQWFRVKVEVRGGTMRFSFDHDLDGDYGEAYISGYHGPITWTTLDPAFHTGEMSSGRVGMIVSPLPTPDDVARSAQHVYVRNLVLWGDSSANE